MDAEQAEAALRRIRARLRTARRVAVLAMVAFAAYYVWLVWSCTRKCDPFTAFMLVACPLALLGGGLVLLTERARSARARRDEAGKSR